MFNKKVKELEREVFFLRQRTDRMTRDISNAFRAFRDYFNLEVSEEDVATGWQEKVYGTDQYKPSLETKYTLTKKTNKKNK